MFLLTYVERASPRMEPARTTNMNKQRLSKTEAEAVYRALLEEKNGIEQYLEVAKQKERRLRELKSGFHSTGELEFASRIARDAEFPTFIPARDWQSPVLIVAVDEKWITIRDEGADEDTAKRYSRTTGLRERTRTGYDNIDVDAALRLWDATAGLRNETAVSDGALPATPGTPN